MNNFFPPFTYIPHQVCNLYTRNVISVENVVSIFIILFQFGSVDKKVNVC